MTDKQKAISDLLRSADKVIKSGKLEEAMKYINKVIELDQRNVYAKAYTERIISLMEAQGISRSDAMRITAEAKFTDAPPQESIKPEPKSEPVPAPPPIVKPVEKVE